MKRSTIAVAGVLALALVGGGTAFALTTAQAPAPVVEETTAPTPEATSTSTTSPEPSPSTEPLIAEPDAEMTEAEAEAAYLVTVRERLSKIRTQIPNATDEQLLTVAHDACGRLESGESGENMTLIEDEELTNGYYMDSGAIIIAARLTICPIEK